ncbi:MAG: signal peptide peptidase SppA [Acidobacteriota bacterium]
MDGSVGAGQVLTKHTRWGLWIFLAILGVIVLGGFLLVVGFASLVSTNQVAVKPDSTLVLSLSSPFQESPPDPIATQLFHAKIYNVFDTVRALDRAAKDERIKSLLIEPGMGGATGLGKLEQLRSAVERFKKSGKPVWAYYESASTGGYYVASCADKIYAPPSGDLILMGPSMALPFFGGTLKKFGIVPQLYHIGAYKSYSDTFTRTDASDAEKEATNAILDSFYGQIVDGIAQGRKLSPDQVKAAIDVGFLWGYQMKQQRLVDDLLYQDQVEQGLKKINGNQDRWNRIDMADYQNDHRINLSEGAKKTVAYVVASGDIVSGEKGPSNIGSETLIRWLRKIGEDSGISAVVLRVDSPGGDALASDVIWRQVQVLRKSKPVVVSMSDLAASGGYYISMGSDGIVAEPGTITGSIGVVTGKFVIKGLLDFVDFNMEIMKRGKNSDLFSSYTPYTPEQEQLIQGQMQSFYKTFVTKAAEGRHQSYEAIDQVGQGRIWSGEDALKLGLVDKLGGIEAAIALAKEKAGIPPKEPVHIVMYPKPKTILQAFLEEKTDSLVRARERSEVPPELWQLYQEYEQVRPLVSEPFSLYTPFRVTM